MCTNEFFTDVLPDGRHQQHTKTTRCSRNLRGEPCQTHDYVHDPRRVFPSHGGLVAGTLLTPRHTPNSSTSSIPLMSGNESDRSPSRKHAGGAMYVKTKSSSDRGDKGERGEHRGEHRRHHRRGSVVIEHPGAILPTTTAGSPYITTSYLAAAPPSPSPSHHSSPSRSSERRASAYVPTATYTAKQTPVIVHAAQPAYVTAQPTYSSSRDAAAESERRREHERQRERDRAAERAAERARKLHEEIRAQNAAIEARPPRVGGATPLVVPHAPVAPVPVARTYTATIPAHQQQQYPAYHPGLRRSNTGARQHGPTPVPATTAVSGSYLDKREAELQAAIERLEIDEARRRRAARDAARAEEHQHQQAQAAADKDQQQRLRERFGALRRSNTLGAQGAGRDRERRQHRVVYDNHHGPFRTEP